MFQTRKPLRESAPASSPKAESAERPRYRLTAPAFFSSPVVTTIRGQRLEAGDLYLEAGSEVETDDPPGAHMEPLNAAAEAMWDKHRPVFRDFIEELPLHGESEPVA